MPSKHSFVAENKSPRKVLRYSSRDALIDQSPTVHNSLRQNEIVRPSDCRFTTPLFHVLGVQMQLKLNQFPLKITSVCNAEAVGVMSLVYSR